MPKVKINVSLSFIIYAIMLIYFGKALFLLSYILVLFIHEYSHGYVAYKLGYKLNSIKLMPFGICLNIDNNNISCLDSVKIAFAGPCTNFILVIICMSIWWAFPQSYVLLEDFFYANVITGVFNLLPCYPLDGGRILKALLGEGKIKIVFYIVNCLFAAVFFLMFVCFSFNISFLMISIFLVVTIFSFSKTPKYDFLLYEEKKITGTNICKVYIVSAELPLYKLLPKITPKEFAIFCIIEKGNVIGQIYENDLKTLLQEYSPTTMVKSVVLKKQSWQKF